MARIPIQTRDVASSQKSPSPRLPQRAPVQPISPRTTQRLEQFAKEQERRAEQAERSAKAIAKADFRNRRDANLIESKTKVADAEGQNAFAARDVERQKLIKSNEQLLQNVPEKWRAEFSTDLDAGLNDFDQFSISHQLKAKDEVADATYKARLANIMGQASLASIDPSQYEAKIEEMIAASTEYGAIKYGGDPELGEAPSEEVRAILAQDRRRLISKTHLESIKLFGAQGDERNIARMLKDYDSDLTPEDKTAALKIQAQAKNSSRVNNAFDLMKIAQERYADNPDQAIKFITAAAGDDGELFRTARSMYQADLAFKSKQRKLADEQKISDALDEIDKNGQISEKTLKSIDSPTKRQQILNYQKDIHTGNYRRTDDKLFTELMGRPELLVEYNLRANRDKFSKEDFLRLEKRKESEMNRDRGDKEKIQHMTDKAVKDIVIEVMAAKDIDPVIDAESAAKMYRLSADILSEVQLEDPDLKNPSLLRERFRQKFYTATMGMEKIELPGAMNAFRRLINSGGYEVLNEPQPRGDVLDPTGPQPRPSGPTASERAHPDFIQRLQQARRNNNLPELSGEALEERLREAEKRGYNIESASGK